MAEEETQTAETTESTESAETTETTETTETQSDDWRASIEDEGARKFADSFQSPAAAAEAAHKFRQQLSTSVVVPGEDADDETKADFRKKMGIPEESSGYTIEPPKDLPEELQAQVFDSDEGKALLDDFRAKMHAVNAPSEAVQQAVETYMGYLVEGEKKQAKDREEALGAADNALKVEWGKDFEANENFGIQAVKTFGGGEFAKFLEETQADGIQLGNHPAFRKAFAAIGRSMGEDGFHVTPSEGEAQGIQEQLSELMGLMDTDFEKYKTPSVQSKIQALNEKLTGDGPSVGSQGRTA